MGTKVLVAVPAKPNMPIGLEWRMNSLLASLLEGNPSLDLELAIFSDEVPRPSDKEASIFIAPAIARNLLLQKHLRDCHEYVLWIDSDLVDYPPSLPTQLLEVNPGGVTAPLILIEPCDTPQDYLFYDVAAFIEAGRPVFARAPHFGNVSHDPPYFAAKGNQVDCLSVGCCYIIPADVHRSGVRFEPTPFTDHYPVICKAREMGKRVVTTRSVVAYHANLPKHGEAWHAEPMQQWLSFPFKEHGLQTYSFSRNSLRGRRALRFG